MRKFFWPLLKRAANALSALIVALIALAAAQGQTRIEIRGKRVIDDAIAALGSDKFLKMEDRIESGRAYSFYHERVSGLSVATIYTRYLTPTEGKTGDDLFVRERQAFGKLEELGYVLFREDGAWQVTFRGAKDLEKDQIDRYRDTTLRNIFYILRIRLGERGLIFESKGVDVVENQPVEIVDITDSQNRVVTVYFNQDTKLPVRQSTVWRDPKTHDRNEEVTRFARYQDAGGVQWPHQITRERNGDRVYQIFSDSVSINRGISDSAFAVPTGPAERVNVRKK